MGKKVVVSNEPSEEHGALAKISKGKPVVEECSKGKRIRSKETGEYSTISGLIEVQICGTEEIDRLTMPLAQGEVDLALLKAEQTAAGTSWEPGAVLALQNENALLREETNALNKYVENRHNNCFVIRMMLMQGSTSSYPKI
ncbi:hypothetical protein HAX54_009966 [Datura stramonium]|uniref:Uncharacterized protein n=1 Tax=Datura stramonium TaxID=4076 RepID=A0ABS8WZB7_DATST|nr:hypothetical protein [Datura stramonium]